MKGAYIRMVLEQQPQYNKNKYNYNNNYIIIKKKKRKLLQTKLLDFFMLVIGVVVVQVKPLLADHRLAAQLLVCTFNMSSVWYEQCISSFPVLELHVILLARHEHSRMYSP